MKIIPQGKGTYLVESKTRKGTFYHVNLPLAQCDCPATKRECIHIKELCARLNDELNTKPNPRGERLTKTEAERLDKI